MRYRFAQGTNTHSQQANRTGGHGRDSPSSASSGTQARVSAAIASEALRANGDRCRVPAQIPAPARTASRNAPRIEWAWWAPIPAARTARIHAAGMS